MNDRLNKIYYDPNHYAGFGSVSQLSKASGISQKNVEKWLQSQETYTLHKQSYKKFRTRQYRTSGIDHQWQADLCDMHQYAQANDGYKWILTVIDIFSRFGWAQPVKSKIATHVQEGFKKIFDAGRKPINLLQTDQGNEFQSAEMIRFFQSRKIKQFSVKSQFKAAIVERYNRTLRNRMQRYFTGKNTHRWVDVLPELVNSYNHSYHRTLGMRPVDVTKTNEMELWDLQEKASTKKVAKKTILKKGMYVRVSKTKWTFEKGYMPNWTTEIFQISDVLNTIPIQVKVIDLNGAEILGSWYTQEVQQVQLPEVYKVEKVLAERKVGRKKQYFVKWVGYSDDFNQWIDQNQMTNIA